MFDYEKILNGEILKEESYTPAELSGHINRDCYGLYLLSDKKVIILQDDFSEDKFGEYLCNLLIKNNPICVVCDISNNDMYYVTKDMQHHYFSNYKFEIIKLYKKCRYTQSSLDFHTSLVYMLNWKVQPCTFYAKNSSMVVYLLEDPNKEFFEEHIINKKYKLNVESGEYRLYEIIIDILPNVWLNTPKREILEQFDYNAPEEDLVEYRKVEFRKKRLEMRRVIAKNYKLYGVDFLDEIAKLSDEDKLSLELKGKLPTLAKEKKKKK